MGTLCGIIDFSASTTDFDTLVKLWQTQAPLGRACAYINKGVSLCAERWFLQERSHLPFMTFEADGENCTVIFDAPPASADLAKKIFDCYRKNGCSVLCDIEDHPTLALLDEGKKTLILSCGSSPIFFTRFEEKIVFATDRKGISFFSDAHNKLPILLNTVELSPGGFAVLCDISTDEKSSVKKGHTA